MFKVFNSQKFAGTRISPYTEISKQLKVTKSNLTLKPTQMKFTIAATALVLVGSLCMDTPERKANRCTDRMNSAQLQEAIITVNHLNSPMPWERK